MMKRNVWFCAVVAAQVYVAMGDCTTTTCILNNGHLRFGNGTASSIIRTFSGLAMPYVFNGSAWQQLGYASTVDMAVGAGTGIVHWTGGVVTALSSFTSSTFNIDYNGFIPTSVDAVNSITTGYGVVSSTRAFAANGWSWIVTNAVTLSAADPFVSVVTTITNTNASTARNMYIWAGMRDDWIGQSDVSLKTVSDPPSSELYSPTWLAPSALP